MKRKYFLTLLITTCSFISSPVLVLADGPKPPGPRDPGTKAPFDGGLSLLVAAGISTGLKKAYDKRKKANAE